MATASRSQPMQPSPNPYRPHLYAPRPRSRPAADRQDARVKALLPMEPLRRDFSGAPERPGQSARTDPLADLLASPDGDAPRAAEVAESVAVVVALQLADEPACAGSRASYAGERSLISSSRA